MNTEITRLTGTANVGGYTIDLEGRAAAPAFGTVIWYRQYRNDPKSWARTPTGRPRKAIFVAFHSRDERDDKWECRFWNGAKRGLNSAVLLIGSKSLHRIEPIRFHHFSVRYRWADKAGRRRTGHTVVTALTQTDAEKIFRRQNPHISEAYVFPQAA